ncbi:MAG: hypothetical protein DWQ34_26520 [Planctomycetota bacterium]|nr:MAG: hypothetical protein DWQ34_26520 [Planctomycetota bacterium]REJ90768.1 MAG: hypothetical protein DWQ29_06365 [Planctomycetota bacterium]REK22777.1 MAG: hypothetical protein DWQ41_18425 [Planctomycetota bacterium]REK33803.1 MAG: hypothetical protein DWQ45_14570 [Planctomycetota bacterium]
MADRRDGRGDRQTRGGIARSHRCRGRRTQTGRAACRGTGRRRRKAGRREERRSEQLTVAPSHGRRGVQRFPLGSVTARLVRLAHCPVSDLKPE